MDSLPKMHGLNGQGKKWYFPVMGKGPENYLDCFDCVSIHDCWSVCPGSKEEHLSSGQLLSKTGICYYVTHPSWVVSPVFPISMMWCEEIQDFHSCLSLSCQAHDPCQLHLFLCLQFWFRFWTLWEFIYFLNKWDQYLKWGQSNTYCDRISPHPPGTGREFIQ